VAVEVSSGLGLLKAGPPYGFRWQGDWERQAGKSRDETKLCALNRFLINKSNGRALDRDRL